MNMTAEMRLVDCEYVLAKECTSGQWHAVIAIVNVIMLQHEM